MNLHKALIANEIFGDGGSGGGGSSDFSTAKVTFKNKKGSFPVYLPRAYYDEYQGEVDAYAVSVAYLSAGSSSSPSSYDIDVVLFYGKAQLDLSNATGTVSISENYENQGGGYYLITGDCVVTIS